MRNRDQLARILERDNGRCGIHLGGCKASITTGRATIDHIVSKSFMRSMDHAVAQDYRADWNTQPMCKECNNIGKHGQMVGFPVFECQCHFLQIDKTGDMFVYETTGMDTNIHLFLENIVEPHTSVALASWRVIPRNSPGKGSQG